jgi:hypothetical protein
VFGFLRSDNCGTQLENLSMGYVALFWTQATSISLYCTLNGNIDRSISLASIATPPACQPAFTTRTAFSLCRKPVTSSALQPCENYVCADNSVRSQGNEQNLFWRSNCVAHLIVCEQIFRIMLFTLRLISGFRCEVDGYLRSFGLLCCV